MEEELRCPACKKLLSEPVLLPCWHALCLGCAVGMQAAPDSPPDSSGDSGVGAAPGSDQEADKLSILSETDSGVVCSSSTSTGSRPGSYVGTPGNGVCFPPSGGTLCLSCPVCQKTVFFDEGGAHNLPKYRAMQRIVDKYVEARNVKLMCQMCEREPQEATVACEQCEVSLSPNPYP
jgi:tripartite motif-containing protein 9/67